MPLSVKQVQNVCLGSNTQRNCRYLYDVGRNCQCLKNTSEQKIIDYDLKQILQKCKLTGQVADVPQGDNCGGYPYTKYVIQGYDQDE